MNGGGTNGKGLSAGLTIIILYFIDSTPTLLDTLLSLHFHEFTSPYNQTDDNMQLLN